MKIRACKYQILRTVLAHENTSHRRSRLRRRHHHPGFQRPRKHTHPSQRRKNAGRNASAATSADSADRPDAPLPRQTQPAQWSRTFDRMPRMETLPQQRPESRGRHRLILPRRPSKCSQPPRRHRAGILRPTQWYGGLHNSPRSKTHHPPNHLRRRDEVTHRGV